MTGGRRHHFCSQRRRSGSSRCSSLLRACRHGCAIKQDVRLWTERGTRPAASGRAARLPCHPSCSLPLLPHYLHCSRSVSLLTAAGVPHILLISYYGSVCPAHFSEHLCCRSLSTTAPSVSRRRIIRLLLQNKPFWPAWRPGKGRQTPCFLSPLRVSALPAAIASAAQHTAWRRPRCLHCMPLAHRQDSAGHSRLPTSGAVCISCCALTSPVSLKHLLRLRRCSRYPRR